MRKFAGFLMIVLGILQGIWIAYNLFIERLPEFQEPVLPISLTALASGLITVGIMWLREPRSRETGK
jgi:fructose-specific phosphotransferase system IIC component